MGLKNVTKPGDGKCSHHFFGQPSEPQPRGKGAGGVTPLASHLWQLLWLDPFCALARGQSPCPALSSAPLGCVSSHMSQGHSQQQSPMATLSPAPLSWLLGGFSLVPVLALAGSRSRLSWAVAVPLLPWGLCCHLCGFALLVAMGIGLVLRNETESGLVMLSAGFVHVLIS